MGTINGCLSIGETAESVLGIVGNFRRIRIIIVMYSIEMASQCLITII